MAAYAGREGPLTAPIVNVSSPAAVTPGAGSIRRFEPKELKDLMIAIRRIELYLGISPSPATGSLRELGWSADEIELTRAKLARVAEDWNDPAMDVYDEL